MLPQRGERNAPRAARRLGIFQRGNGRRVGQRTTGTKGGSRLCPARLLDDAGGKRQPSELRCRVDQRGRQHFNFRQHLWIDPAVPMACTRGHSTALLTLAVNLLLLGMAERRARLESEPAVTARLAIGLARRFVDECLLDCPEMGWVMPREAIGAWVSSHWPGNAHSRVSPGRATAMKRPRR